MSCSSGGKNSSVDEIKDDEIVGKDVPSWTEDNGIISGRLVAVGYSEMAVSKSPRFVEKAALMDGETKLLADAPQDFRILTQNSLTGAGIESSEFVQIQTSLKEVMGVEGFKRHEKTCRKIVRYTESNDRNILRGCWYRVSADLNKLQEAYRYILEKKYGRGKADKFKELMGQEIDKINDHKKFD
ncbi:MAG: hypothetical protein CME71_00305 [Halobacteriovorax sp.]|nr:hypothetical protein [Halobacteriovorax sp.]